MLQGQSYDQSLLQPTLKFITNFIQLQPNHFKLVSTDEQFLKIIKIGLTEIYS